MSLDFTDDQSTLVQVMAWCRQATSHYLSQCWPRSLSPYGVTRPLGPLAPGKFEWNCRHVIFKQILVIDDWGISCEIALIWMSLDFTDDQSTLVQVMAWCRQATSHYLSQCWPRSLSPYGVTRPQWVNSHPCPQWPSSLCHQVISGYGIGMLANDIFVIRIGISAWKATQLSSLWLTHKQWETRVYSALQLLYPQCWLNIHCFDQFRTLISQLYGMKLENKTTLRKNYSAV